MKVQKKKVHSSLDCLLASRQINFIDQNKAQHQIKGGSVLEDDIVVF